jgi:hypothetical protein
MINYARAGGPVYVHGYQRISKAAARKLWNAGDEFVIVPHKMIPGCWASFPVRRNSDDHSFETFLNTFNYYNSNWECGYYPAFYNTKQEA